MGLEVAKILSSKGAHIVIVSRSVSKLEDAVRQIKVISFGTLHNLLAETLSIRQLPRVHSSNASTTSAQM